MLLKFNLCRAAIKVWISFRQVVLNLLSFVYLDPSSGRASERRFLVHAVFSSVDVCRTYLPF